MTGKELVRACKGRLHDLQAERILVLFNGTPRGGFIAALVEAYPGLDSEMVKDIEKALCPKPTTKKEGQ